MQSRGQNKGKKVCRHGEEDNQPHRFFCKTIHYDEHGRKIGESMPGFLGGTNHYDNRGHKIGHFFEGLFGGTTTRLRDKK